MTIKELMNKLNQIENKDLPIKYFSYNGYTKTIENIEIKGGNFLSTLEEYVSKYENILYLNPQDEKNDKLYYLMKPVFLLLK